MSYKLGFIKALAACIY